MENEDYLDILDRTIKTTIIRKIMTTGVGEAKTVLSPSVSQILEPPTGEELQSLMQEADNLQSQLMEARSFARFLEIIAILTGGEMEGNKLSSRYLIDEHNSRALRIFAYPNEHIDHLRRPMLVIDPSWVTLIKSERDDVLARMTEPYLRETVSFAYAYQVGASKSPVVATIHHHVAYPPNYKNSLPSFYLPPSPTSPYPEGKPKLPSISGKAPLGVFEMTLLSQNIYRVYNEPRPR